MPDEKKIPSREALLSLLNPEQRAALDYEPVKEGAYRQVNVPVRGDQGGDWTVTIYYRWINQDEVLVVEPYTARILLGPPDNCRSRCMRARGTYASEQVDAFAEAAAMIFRIETDEAWVRANAGG